MNIAEKMLKYLINYVLTSLPEEMEFFDKFIEPGLIDRLKAVVSKADFARVTYTEAVELLIKSGRNLLIQWSGN